MRRIRLVKERVEYCQSTTDKMTMGDLVYDLESRVYMVVFRFEDGNVHGGLNLVNQDWARNIDRVELEKRAQL